MKNEYIILILSLLVLISLYLFFRIREKEQNEKIRDLCKVRDDLNLQLANTKEIVRPSESNNPKSTLVYEQVKKIESLEAEVLKRKQRNANLRIIAQNASMAQQNFLANIRDEIQKPLFSVLDSCQLLQLQLKDKTSRNQLNNIRSSSNNLLLMFQKMIDFSKMEADAFEIVEKITDIHSLLKSILETQQKKADAKSLILTLDIDKKLPTFLLLDRVRVEAIFKNLLENAIKFTDKGSVRVNVEVDRIDSAANTLNFSVHVEDTGIGIDSESQEKIFEVFGKLKGFGLSIDKKIASLLGGDITLKSEPSKGSTFKFSLSHVEIALLDDEVADNGNVDFSLVKAHSKIMLIAEYNKNHQTIMDAFEETKAELFAYSDLREAIQTLKDETIDLIFIDVDILNRDDGAVSKVLRQMTKAGIVPLVEERVKEIDFKDKVLKPVGFLKKPISKSELFKISLKVLNA